MDPFIYMYLIVQNVDLFVYCPLTFYTHVLLVVDRYCSQFTEYMEKKQPQKIYERQNIRIYRDVRKVGPFTYKSRKMGSVIYFVVEKSGLIIYLAALEKGAIRHAHPYYAIYRKLPSPTTPRETQWLNSSSSVSQYVLSDRTSMNWCYK